MYACMRMCSLTRPLRHMCSNVSDSLLIYVRRVQRLVPLFRKFQPYTHTRTSRIHSTPAFLRTIATSLPIHTSRGGQEVAFRSGSRRKRRHSSGWGTVKATGRGGGRGGFKGGNFTHISHTYVLHAEYFYTYCLRISAHAVYRVCIPHNLACTAPFSLLCSISFARAPHAHTHYTSHLPQHTTSTHCS